MIRCDLTGMRFGKITVIKRANSRGRNGAWICKCDCGNTLTVNTCDLKTGNTKSCGCGRIKDLSGQKFGRLTAIKIAGIKHGTGALWECECECGRKEVVSAKNLISGETKSCGCLAKEKSRERLADFLFEESRPNYLNEKIGKANTSGFRGVYFDKKINKWRVSIGVKNKNIYIGVFNKKEDAIKARKTAEEKYWEPIKERFAESQS